MEKTSNTYKITLEIQEEDICAAWEYEKFIEKHLKKGSKIPARVIKKFSSFFIEVDKQLKDKFYETCDVIKEKTKQRYVADKEYNFVCNLESAFSSLDFPSSETLDFPTTRHKKSKCYFESMLDSIFISLKDNYETVTVSKDEFIKVVFNSINGYFSLFKGDTYKHFSLYKRRAITGYITHLFGFHLSTGIRQLEGAEPPNELLVDAVKYKTPRQLEIKKKPAKK